MEATNKEICYTILKEYGICSSKEIANLAWRKYNIQITPAQAAGGLRPLVKAGRVGSSKDTTGTHYWLNKEADMFSNDVELNDITGLYRFKK